MPTFTQLQDGLQLFQRAYHRLLSAILLAPQIEPDAQACRVLERRVLCSAIGAFLAGALALIPAALVALVIDRAVAAHSVETLVVLVVFGTAFFVLQAALAYVAQRYLTESWLSVGLALGASATTPAHKAAIGAIDKAFATGAMWHALGLSSLPLVCVMLALVHPLMLALGVVLCAAAMLANWAGIPAMSKGLLVISGLLSMAVSATLVIMDLATMGGLVSGSILIGRMLQPVVVVSQYWPLLAKAREAYCAIRTSPTIGNLRADPTHDREATRSASSVVTVNAMALVLMTMFLAVPIQSVVVMEGRAIAEGHSKVIKAAVSGRVAAMSVVEGAHVAFGGPLIAMDSSGLVRQRDEVQLQIGLDESALAASIDDVALRSGLLASQVAAITPLVAKGLKPEAELTAARLRVADFAALSRERRHTLQTSVSRLRERLAELERAITQSTITSPADGVVQGLIGIAPGSNVNAGDTLLTVVPKTLSLIEARLDPTDRGSLFVGAKVDLKIKVSRTRYGETIGGVVTGISADQIEATPGTARGYKVLISTDRPVQTGVETEIISTANKDSGASWIVDVVGSALRRAAR